jgi:aspartate/glutamate racemase
VSRQILISIPTASVSVEDLTPKCRLLSIPEEASECVQASGKKTIGLLGSRFTMSNKEDSQFYSQASSNSKDVEIFFPGHLDQSLLHELIISKVIVSVHETTQKANADIVQGNI